MARHVGARVFLILLTCVIFVIVATLNFLAYRPNILIFRNTSDVISEIYSTEVTPADFTFTAIWIAIYAYLGLFLLYALTTLFRSSGPGFLYTHPNYLPPSVYIAFLVSQLSLLIWIFLWVNEQIVASLLFLLIAATCAYVSLAVASHGIFTNQKALVSTGHAHEYRWVMALVINPLGLYAMWLSVSTLVNLSVVLVHTAGVSPMAGGSISLAVLTGAVVIYALIDLAFFERYFRYLFTPVLCLIWAFIGILVGNLDWDTSNTVFTLGLTIVTIVLFLLKVVLSIVRSCRKPLFKTTEGEGTLPTYIAQPAPVVVKTSSPEAALPTWPSLT